MPNPSDSPVSRPDMAGMRKRYAKWNQEVIACIRPDIYALIAHIEALEAWMVKLETRLKIEERAVERWVPCPDHRDKINPGYEEARCYVCENETLRRKLAALGDGDG